MSYEGLQAEVVSFKGHNGDTGEAYYARPTAGRRSPGRGHHAPAGLGRVDHRGDAQVRPSRLRRDLPAPLLPRRAGQPRRRRRAAARGRRRLGRAGDGRRRGRRCYLGRSPTPTARSASSASARAGGTPTSRPAAVRHRRRGRLLGRQRGRRRSGKALDAEAGRADRSHRELTAPLLGIFGNDDANPNREQVNRTEAVLKKLGKDYEFHRYDGSGHGFFNWARPAYRPEQAADGWAKVFAFLKKHVG